MFNNHSFHF